MLNSTKILKELKPYRDLLVSHRIYKSVRSVSDAKTFMKSHVYAVWDFMSLLKSLQAKMTVSQIPWFPCPDRISANFINSIVLSEESDNFSNNPEESMSHYELYIEGMKELGAFTEPIESLISDVKKGSSIDQILASHSINYSSIIPTKTINFVKKNLKNAQEGSEVQVAASFLFGREDPIPDMFQGLLNEIDHSGIQAEKFKIYLKRHILLDRDNHGPLSMIIMNRICQDDQNRWKQVFESAREAILDRIELWDGILEQLDQKPTIYEASGGKVILDTVIDEIYSKNGFKSIKNKENFSKFVSDALNGPKSDHNLNFTIASEDLEIFSKSLEKKSSKELKEGGYCFQDIRNCLNQAIETISKI